VTPTRIVERIDVVADRGGGRRPERLLALRQFGLQRREEALEHRVVPRIAGAAHAAHHAFLGQYGAVLVTGVLRPTVRVMPQPRMARPPGQRLTKRGEHERARQLVAHRIADDATGIEIEEHGQGTASLRASPRT
jgi:hypothetical protein